MLADEARPATRRGVPRHTDTTGPSLGRTNQARTSTEECERLLAAFRRFIPTERETSPADPETPVDLGREIAGDRTTPEIDNRPVVGPGRADPGAPASRGPAAVPEAAALDGGEALDGAEIRLPELAGAREPLGSIADIRW